VAPGAAAAFVVGTAHEVTSVLPGVQVKDTEPVNPPSPVMVTGKVPMAPFATLTLDGAEAEKSHAVPVSGTDCGLPLALSVTMIVPVSVPGVVDPDGANVMLSVQGVPVGAIVMGTLPHEFDAMLKSLLAVIAEMFSAVVVLRLLITRFCPMLVVVSNWPPKVRLVGLKLIPAIVLLPVPVSATRMGRAAVSRLSTICIVTARAPTDEGVNMTPTVQLAPAASEATHVPPPPVVVKSEALPPTNVGGRVSVTADEV
jgi:hypothetical protein